MKTWFKYALAAVCSCVFAWGVSAANVSDEMNSKCGDVVKSQSAEGVNIYTVTWQDATRRNSSIVTGTGSNTTWQIQATIKKWDLNNDDVAKSNINFRLNGEQKKFTSPANYVSEDLMTEVTVSANTSEKSYVLTVKKSFKPADLRVMYQNPEDADLAVKAELEFDWDKSGTYESKYVLTVDPKTLVLNDASKQELWNVNALYDITAGPMRNDLTGNAVFEGPDSNNVFCAFGNFQNEKKTVNAIQFTYTNLAVNSKLEIAAVRFSDNLGNALVSEMPYPYYYTAIPPTASSTINSYSQRLDGFGDYSVGLSNVFFRLPYNRRAYVGFAGVGFEMLKKRCEIAALNGTNYIVNIDFDLDGDGDHENNYSVVFDPAKIQFNGAPVSEVSKAAFKQVVYKRSNAGVETETAWKGNHVGTIDGTVVTYEGGEPALRSSGNNYWDAPLKIELPSWFTLAKAKIGTHVKGANYTYYTCITNGAGTVITNAVLSWCPQITAAELVEAKAAALAASNEVGEVVRRLELDLDEDGNYETVYSAVFKTTLHLYLHTSTSGENPSKWADPSGYVFPCETNATGCGWAYLFPEGTNDQCSVATAVGTNPTIKLAETMTESATGSKAWEAVFDVVAPKWVYTDPLAKKVAITGAEFINPINLAKGYLWSSKNGERYVFTVKVTFADFPKTLVEAGANPLDAVTINWGVVDEDAAVPMAIAFEKPVQLNYASGEVAWKATGIYSEAGAKVQYRYSKKDGNSETVDFEKKDGVTNTLFNANTELGAPLQEGGAGNVTSWMWPVTPVVVRPSYLTSDATIKWTLITNQTGWAQIWDGNAWQNIDKTWKVTDSTFDLDDIQIAFAQSGKQLLPVEPVRVRFCWDFESIATGAVNYVEYVIETKTDNLALYYDADKKAWPTTYADYDDWQVNECKEGGMSSKHVSPRGGAEFGGVFVLQQEDETQDKFTYANLLFDMPSMLWKDFNASSALYDGTQFANITEYPKDPKHLTGIQGEAALTFTLGDYINAVAYNGYKLQYDMSLAWQPWVATTNYTTKLDLTETTIKWTDGTPICKPSMTETELVAFRESLGMKRPADGVYKYDGYKYYYDEVNKVMALQSKSPYDGSDFQYVDANTATKIELKPGTVNVCTNLSVKDIQTLEHTNYWAWTVGFELPSFVSSNLLCACFLKQDGGGWQRGIVERDGKFFVELEVSFNFSQSYSSTAGAYIPLQYTNLSFSVKVDPKNLTVLDKDGYQIFPFPTAGATFKPFERDGQKAVTLATVVDDNTLLYDVSNTIAKVNIKEKFDAISFKYVCDDDDTVAQNWAAAVVKRPTCFDNEAYDFSKVRFEVSKWVKDEGDKKVAEGLMADYYIRDGFASDAYSTTFFSAVQKDDVEDFVANNPEASYYPITIKIDWARLSDYLYRYASQLRYSDTYTILIDVRGENMDPKQTYAGTHANLEGTPWTQKQYLLNDVKFGPAEGAEKECWSYTLTAFDWLTMTTEPVDTEKLYEFRGYWADRPCTTLPFASSNLVARGFAEAAPTTGGKIYRSWRGYALNVNGKDYTYDAVDSIVPDAGIRAAFAAIKDGSVVTIKDADKNGLVELNAEQTIDKNNVTIDLGGNTLVVTCDLMFCGSNTVVSNGTIRLVKNAGIAVDGASTSVKFFNVKVEDDDVILYNEYAIDVTGGATLTVDASKINLRCKPSSAGFVERSSIVYVSEGSTIEIVNEGAIKNLYQGVRDGLYPAAIATEGTVIANNAKISPIEGVGIFSYGTNAVVKIAGSCYIAGYSAIDMEAGKLIVEAADDDTMPTFNANGIACDYDVSAAEKLYAQTTGEAIIFGSKATVEIASGKFVTEHGRAIAGYDAKGALVKSYDESYPVLAATKGWKISTPEVQDGIPQGYYNTNEFEMQKLVDGTAIFAAKNFTLKYVLNEGTQTGTLPAVYTVESTSALPTCVERKNWYFAGWYLDAALTKSAVTFADVVAELKATGYADVTVYAKWTETAYTLTLKAGTTVNPVKYENDAAFVSQEVGFDVTKTYTVKIPSCKGYTFLGWLDAETGIRSDPAAEIELNTLEYNGKTLTAQWEANVYAITYVDARGNEAELVYTVESNVTFPTDCTADGYDFVKWSIPSTEGYAEDLTVTASWTSKVNGKATSAIDAAVAFNPASTLYYTGFVVKDGAMLGTVSFTAAKAVKAGTSTVRATVKLLDEKTSTRTEKVTVADTASEINLGTVLGKAKINNDVAEAESVFASLNAKVDAAKKFVVAFDTLDAEGTLLGETTLRISLAKSGKATVSGILFDGTSFSTTAQAMTSANGIILPIVYNRSYNYAGYTNYGGMAALLRIDGDTITFEKDVTPSIVVYNKGVQTAAKLVNNAAGVVDTTATLKAGAKVTVEDGFGNVATGYVNKYGTSVSFAKADLGGASSGRLSYTKSTGALTGSFTAKVYGKNVTFSVKGVVVGCKDAYATGYGTVSGTKVTGAPKIVIDAE